MDQDVEAAQQVLSSTVEVSTKTDASVPTAKPPVRE